MNTPADLLKRYELTPSKDNVLLEHKRQLWQARFSPDGRFLVGCGNDATLVRWDMSGAEPRPMPALSGHNGWLQAMGFIPATTHVLAADSWGQLSCRPYDEETPSVIWSNVEAHDGWIRALAVSPDGQTVATGGNDRVVRLWSTADGMLRSEWKHDHRVFSLQYHPDGRHLVSGDLIGTIRHWDVTQQKEVRQLNASVLYADEAETKGRIQQCGGVRQLSFDAVGERLVCGGQKEPGGGFANGTPCVVVFDWATGEILREMPMGGAQDGFCYDVQFHPDGFVMATSSAFPGKGHVWFWRPEDDAAFFSSGKLANGRSLSIHPNGRQVAHLTANAPNANGRPLKDGEYVGGHAVVRLLEFPFGD